LNQKTNIMKLKYLNKSFLAVLAISLGIVACEKKKEIIAPWDIAGSNSNFAHLRIVHASPNFRTITGQADSIHIFVNGSKINGVRLSYGGAFPAINPTTYATVPHGNVQLKVSVGGLVNVDSIAVATINTTFNQGENYSFILTDSLLSANRDSARILVKDSFPTPLNGRTWLRFVHTLVDTAADKRVDVWSARRNNNLFANVQPGSVGAFTNQPFINFPDTLIVRRAGTMTELARLSNITYANQRVYTIFLRGDVKVATGLKARAVSWYANR
jgi:hypothetical protein